MIIRARARAAACPKAPQPSPEGTTFAPAWQRAASDAVPPLDRDEAAQPAARDVLEEDPLDRILRAEREDLLDPRHGEHPRHANG